MDAVLLGIVPWALLAFRELISTRRARLSLGGTPRTVGARSPPLQPA